MFLSESHKTDLYSWNFSTTVRDLKGVGGKESKNTAHKWTNLPSQKPEIGAASPYVVYHDLCNRLAAQAIDEESAGGGARRGRR